MVPSAKALANHGIDPLPLASKEPLGILNGTAFSAAVGALALNEAVHFAMLAQVCTAMGTEALVAPIEAARNIYNLLEGTTFASVHHEEVHIAEDQGTLRQDRYPLRTSPQFLGPQLEDILHAYVSVTQECNSTTDNPLIDGETGEIHHGGNFQAMAVTNAMEKTRLALHHIGKLLFAQCTELVNPAMNNGLPPSLAATDPSLNYHTKGIDIATAAYVSELGYLANPVSTHIQSAEMHNQAVKWFFGLDFCSCHGKFTGRPVASDLLVPLHPLPSVSPIKLEALTSRVLSAAQTSLDTSGSMDAHPRMKKMASTTTIPLFDFLTELTLPDAISSGIAMVSIPSFRSHLTSRATALLDQLRRDYLSGQRGAAPASPYLNKTRMVYEFVRLTLGVKMHGSENYARFAKGLGVEDETIGQNISRIHEAIRDGKMQAITVAMFA
ncbi:phenylalanine ammonia-lyase [Salix suchowensis]|nr:phenylalanine ammonia-lyase [Salix suchowensis]